MQAVVGLLVAGVGVTGIALHYRPVAALAYPIVWWGLLLAVDAIHLTRWKISPIRWNIGHFLGITVPLSVMFWLLYEFLNLFYPQWRYRGHLQGTAIQMAFGFASYATVIPIVVEFQWLIGGPTTAWRPPMLFRDHVKKWWFLYVGCGLGFMAIPIGSNLFWLNQAVWIAPAFCLLPFVITSVIGEPASIPRGRRFLGSVVGAAVISGFLWELINFWSWTKWEYLIRLNSPHLFAMPVLGYLGFVPFAFSALAAYIFQMRIKMRKRTVAALYGTAIIGLYVLVQFYAKLGYWIPVA